MMPITDSHEMISIPLGIGRSNVDFAVKVVDNSMEPLLCNGDMILIKSKHCPKHGELEVFMMDDGVMHLKRCYFSGKQCRLESLNAAIPDITVNDYKVLNCIGKVVRILHPVEYRIEEM